MDRLQNKVAIVFGAGPNIGGTIAHFLAREGAKVAVSDINVDSAEETAEFIRGKGYEAFGLQGNARDDADVRRIVEQTVARYGRLDVVVNMAGRVHWSHVLDMKLDDWNDAVGSFATAGLLTTQHGARAMRACGANGSIIHIMSTAAHFGEADGACYCAAKAALLNFARSAAMDLGPLGIRVNTITPCSMEHQLWTTMRDEMFDPNWQEPKRTGFYSRQEYLDQMPLRRFPRAADLAWAAVFLASDESICMTGADIAVDGGLRHKYPTWTPGRHYPLDIRDYARSVQWTRYGEEQGSLTEWLGEPKPAA
ncbi:SDR family oxidoreductase [Caldimonas thermodepolymerans]|jgi:Dehydrogenases with different specificities (related to short-chain alcohol dehydrogenases)|uniref:3-oxoacyl-[acyl-carrier protein] reductase n=1 Tax=Caldimonas thermodepolymerans TaxID=215580 RepID=A0A2S5T117_9BURK|nr:SDR family oxidoreductase [Caldimonas thermodepolymerans]PPE68670.1 short-chain dehydrogenase [Caldimonas thermodepolymerans]QPC31504.1 SDR family oxidoreductase [Caldimonas thermodepolymerans]RDH95148.1 3-oxoacyl-[acyl-carrier protein] reductase [Caldimonas thermodepolymerans]TCP03227.1 3-oxoacyl-[acyl-carrier protein] reductase [Caldimonas thermodepolymerans]UZG44256.1 SDR family oxidoreductase [Caldimonas thermodepolymerans]